MILRDAMLEDLAIVAESSISRGVKEHTASVDIVYALEHDGHVIAVGGLKLLNPTVAWAWIDFTAEVREHVKDVYRATTEWLDTMMTTHGLKRVMASVDPDFTQAIRLVEHMGFELESVMLRFFGDRPGLLYVRLRR